MKVFFDSSAFAKRYVEEPGSDVTDALCAEATDLALSIICVPEIVSALNRRVRERQLSRRQYQLATQHLSEDVRDAVIVNLTSPVVSTCISLLESNPLRGMDALHVACAIHWDAELFVSADKQQVAAARQAGLRTRLIPPGSQ